VAGTQFEVGRSSEGGWHLALAVIGQGNVGCAIIAERAVSLFAPDLLLFVGVAGALKDYVALGDVVVATRVDAYHGGTAADAFRSRPRTFPAPHRLEQVAQHVALGREWWRFLPETARRQPPKVHLKPIAAGEVLLDSPLAAVAAHLRLHHDDAVAIEMEGAGLAQAAHYNDALPALVIRGISDRADGTKTQTDRVGGRETAAAHAAAFAVALLAEPTVLAARPSTADGRSPSQVSSVVLNGQTTVYGSVVGGDQWNIR
jgi:8-oxo-dGTP diphosphatase